MNEEKPKKVYLTKRLLVSLSQKAFKNAAIQAMEVMGYVVIAQDGWIIKKYKDGRIERIKEIVKEDVPLNFD